jgi:NitT/TauT family transport system substrate-binding protein
MPSISRRHFNASALGLALVGLGSGPNVRAAELRKFVVTEPGHFVDSLPFYAGIKKGFFREAGLDIQLITTEGGGKHIAAVLSGNADAYIGGPEHIAFVKAKGGAPMRAIVSMSNRANAFVVAKTGVVIDPAKSFAANIKGKRIALGTRGGTDYSILLYLLNRDGLDPRADVQLIEIAATAGMMAAVKTGQADLAVVSEPAISQGVKEGIWQEPFASMPKELGLFAWTTINLPLKLIQSDPALAKALVSAMLKSLDYVATDEAGMRDIAKQEFPTLPANDLEAILARTVANGMWQRDGAMPKEAWDKLESIVTIAGMLKEKVPYADVFDPEFLPT